MFFHSLDLKQYGLGEYMYYVYILKCCDNSPYTGFTENLKERFKPTYLRWCPCN
jgi:hypothetical protein